MRMHWMSTSISLCTASLCILTSAALAEQNWNDAASITVKRVERVDRGGVKGWDERGKPYYIPVPDPNQKLDLTPNANKYDVIIAKKPPNAITMAYRRTDAFKDPVDDGALFFREASPGGPPKFPTLPPGGILVRVERRRALGAIYWVEVAPTFPGTATEPSSQPSTPPWWGVEVDTAITSGTLVLKDTNSGYGVGDSAALGPPPPDTLGCDVAVDGKGDVKFWLHEPNGSYTWTIAPDVPGPNTDPNWAGTPKVVNNIVPGEYTLTVTGGSGFERKIKFVVVKITLEKPTQNQEFAIVMQGPTMPTVQLKAAITPNMTGLQYRFKVGNPANRRALEYVDAPAKGYTHPSIIDSGWIATRTWNINFGNTIYGGNVTHVTVSIHKANFEYSRTISRSFYIVGGSLGGALRNGYIGSLNQYTANIRLMAKAIALQESCGTHYWPTGYHIGTASHHRYPLREKLVGGGYGVMQLTSPNLLNRDTIWNWKKNIDMSMAYIKKCYDRGVVHLNNHPAGVTDRMKRLEGYERYNGGLGDRYHWWSTGPGNHNGVPGGWTKFGYKIVDESWKVFRDYNNDGTKDAAGNPYNIPNGPTGENRLHNSATRYADTTIAREP